MREHAEIVVIGGGQAGLCTSFFLARYGQEHVVLEQGRVAETWRTQRWESFTLNTPNWTLQLPGHGYAGDGPDAFMPRDDVVSYLERYAEVIDAPLRPGVRVASLERTSDGYLLETSEGPLEADTVVVATGAFQRPRAPAIAGDRDPRILQLHTSDYRSPDQLPAGAVLVIGSGQSGCQIAEELVLQGRGVYLSVGRCPWAPRRYRGRDLVHWMIDLGLMDETVDTLPAPAARRACNPSLTGDGGGHDCHPRTLARLGVVLVGRVEVVRRGKIHIGPDLETNLAKGDEFEERLLERIDGYVADAGLDVPHEPAGVEVDPKVDSIRELDCRSSGIATIIWANGYRPDFDWIHLDAFDGDGWPVHVRGCTAFPGLYFVGLHWLHTRKSALFLGVGEDAEHVARHIVGAPAPVTGS